MSKIDLNKINAEFYDFIKKNENADINKLRLKKYSEASFDVQLAITQIECRKKIKRKLPEIYSSPRFIFPSILATEQCTCEIIAKLHAEIIGQLNSMLDMTSGLGIDDYYISKKVKHLTAIELNQDTADTLKYNMGIYAKNITVLDCNSVEYIENCAKNFDVIFIDPARRGDNNSRLFGIKDCEPNIIPIIPHIKKIADTLYVKASPMIDLTESLRELPNVTDVWIVSLKNECKELFFKINFKGNSSSTNIHCLNYVSEGLCQELNYIFEDGIESLDSYSEQIKKYLYEPNASLMKAHAFNVISDKYPKMAKLATNSHLFTSDTLYPTFPGRIFNVVSSFPFKDKIIKKELKGTQQINVSVRNFKLSAEQLKQRLKLKDGGDKYLFGTTTYSEEMIIIICVKAN